MYTQKKSVKKCKQTQKRIRGRIQKTLPKAFIKATNKTNKAFFNALVQQKQQNQPILTTKTTNNKIQTKSKTPIKATNKTIKAFFNALTQRNQQNKNILTLKPTKNTKQKQQQKTPIIQTKAKPIIKSNTNKHKTLDSNNKYTYQSKTTTKLRINYLTNLKRARPTGLAQKKNQHKHNKNKLNNLIPKTQNTHLKTTLHKKLNRARPTGHAQKLNNLETKKMNGHYINGGPISRKDILHPHQKTTSQTTKRTQRIIQKRKENKQDTPKTNTTQTKTNSPHNKKNKYHLKDPNKRPITKCINHNTQIIQNT